MAIPQCTVVREGTGEWWQEDETFVLEIVPKIQQCHLVLLCLHGRWVIGALVVVK